MNKLLLLFGMLISVSSVHAGELIVLKSVASGPIGTNEELVARVKSEVLAKRPSDRFVQVSDWWGNVYAEPRLRTVFVGGEASFADPNEPLPHFINLKEQGVASTEDGVPEATRSAQAQAIKKAQFFCNSELESEPRWQFSQEVLPNGFIRVFASAEFHCL